MWGDVRDGQSISACLPSYADPIRPHETPTTASATHEWSGSGKSVLSTVLFHLLVIFG